MVKGDIEPGRQLATSRTCMSCYLPLTSNCKTLLWRQHAYESILLSERPPNRTLFDAIFIGNFLDQEASSERKVWHFKKDRLTFRCTMEELGRPRFPPDYRRPLSQPPRLPARC